MSSVRHLGSCRGPVVGVNELLAAALDYAARGWPVLPLKPGEKVPAGILVPRGLHQATTDPGVLCGWWKRVPAANIGIRTGIEFDALDVDALGWPTVARLVAVHGAMAIGPVAMTPGGGAHDLFLPTGAGNRAGFAPGLDWRGRRGYIVAPPSRHPNGGQYEWAIPPGDRDFPLCEAPLWLVDLILPKPATSTPIMRPAEGGAYARAALRAERDRVASAPEGVRNATLNTAAFNLAQLVAAGLLDADEAVAALLAAAASCGLPEAEARRTVASGFRGGLASPRAVA